MTDYRALRVALVGCGAVSRLYYAPALQDLERLRRVRLAALFDPVPANTTPIQQAFPGAVLIRDIEELAPLDLDLAIVASPPQYHSEQTIRLLQAGLAVLCEKPMALSVAEGEAMVAAASAAQRLLAVGLVRRFLPSAQTIHGILSQNLLGNVKSFSCSEGRVFRWPVQSASYFRHNGVLRDIGVHILDLLNWWWGEPEEIRYEDDAMGGVELNCRIHLKFRQGFSGEVRLSREFRWPNSFAIQCRNGNITWDLDESNRLQVDLLDSGYSLVGELHHTIRTGHGLILPGSVAADFHQSFVNQLNNVIAAVQGTESLRVSGETGIASLKAIESCYARRTLMNMPWLSDQETPLARQPKESYPE